MVAALQWKNSSQPVLSDIRTQQLMQAAQDGECDKINILVSGGLNVDCENVNGTTALMKAVSYGQAHAVHALLDLGAAVNKARPDGFTPLILAVFFGHENIVTELLAHGADFYAKSRGTCASTWANARGFYSIALLLESIEKSPGSLNVQSRLEPALIQPAPSIARMTIANSKGDAGSDQLIEQVVAKPSALPATTWNVHDALSGEGIRRIGGSPEPQVKIDDAWDRPLENVPPFSPYSTLLARLSTKGNLAVATTIMILVVGVLTAGAAWRMRLIPASLVKAPAKTAPSGSTPINPVASETAKQVQTSAASNSNPVVDKNTESIKPEQPSAGTKQLPVAVTTDAAAESRILKNSVKTPNNSRVHHRGGVIAGDASNINVSEESNRPAAVTIISKPPTTSSTRPRVTNDLPAEPIAPLAGSTNKKRVIQWP